MPVTSPLGKGNSFDKLDPCPAGWRGSMAGGYLPSSEEIGNITGDVRFYLQDGRPIYWWSVLGSGAG